VEWLQIELRVPAAAIEAVDAELQQLGALSISLSDPGGEPILEPAPGTTPLWSQALVAALLPATSPESEVRARLGRVLGTLTPAMTFSRIEERDWVREFRENLAPMRFGERLWICPEGVECPEPGRPWITLEPGMAFGSGSHPTTAMCLHWLAGLQLAERSVLDWGCGSGILALAAVVLGANSAMALDIDAQALQATFDNARRNHCAGALQVSHPDGLPGDARFDVVVANILAGSLVELAPRLARHCRAGARVALSGILATQAQQVIDGCKPWLALSLAMQRDDWILLTGAASIDTMREL
jgi:ribosomal protein L11 methyltransferase